MITPEEKQKIREATDIVALVGETVQLRSRGSDLWGCCPFHHEKSPSFHVRPDRGFWKCFSCGKGGDCFDYVMERDHLEFGEALRYLADRAGIELSDDGSYERGRANRSPKARLYEAVEEAVGFYHTQLTRVRGSGSDAARSYLAGRGFGSDVAKRWDLGYAPGGTALVKHLGSKGFSTAEMVEANLAIRKSSGQLADRFVNRVMFPIRDERGRAIGMGGRVLDDSKPKYLNTSETPIFHKGSSLYALNAAKAYITAAREAIVMEGYTDVIASHEAGLRNAVAPLGTAFRARHVKILARYLTGAGEVISRGRIVCLFDGDEAGIKAAERALQFVGVTTAGMYCVVLPDGKDPAEFIAERGVDELRAYLANPQPLVRFVIDRHLDRYAANTPEERVVALADVVNAMAPIRDTPLAGDYVSYVAGRLGVDEATVRSSLATVRWTAPRDDDDYEEDAAQPIVQGGYQARLEVGEGPADGGGQGAGFENADLPRILPGDAVLIRVERELLGAMSDDIDEARPYAARIADMTWCDPRHEAIAWAMLSTPEGSTPADVLTAACQACDQASYILADGTSMSTGEAQTARALDILLDDLEIRELRRSVDRGKALLKAADAGDTEHYDALFEELAGYQSRLHALETKIRSTV